MAAVLGVDGCPGGWVGALVGAEGQISWHVGSFAQMLALRAEVVAVDIPIGLPSGGARRQADVAARRILGASASSVFFTPCREVLAASDHLSASELSRAAGGVGVSVQTYSILPKIREVDELLQANVLLRSRVVEAHPEVSFRHLMQESSRDAEPLPRKVLASGRAARLALLRSWQPHVQLPSPRPGRCSADDCLDALVCAWTGWRFLRGEAQVLGGEVDAKGLPMRICS